MLKKIDAGVVLQVALRGFLPYIALICVDLGRFLFGLGPDTPAKNRQHNFGSLLNFGMISQYGKVFTCS